MSPAKEDLSLKAEKRFLCGYRSGINCEPVSVNNCFSQRTPSTSVCGNLLFKSKIHTRLKYAQPIDLVKYVSSYLSGKRYHLLQHLEVQQLIKKFFFLFLHSQKPLKK